MDLSRYASGDQIYKMWRTLKKVPGGKSAFSKLVGRAAPYTGSIGGQVVTLRPGYAKVRMRDRRSVRNHLDSIHAVALVNLAEMTTGLAMMSGLPTDGRAILKGIEIEYLVKARGTLVGECSCEPPETVDRNDVILEGILSDAAGTVVAKAKAHWLVGPKR